MTEINVQDVRAQAEAVIQRSDRTAAYLWARLLRWQRALRVKSYIGSDGQPRAKTHIHLCQETKVINELVAILSSSLGGARSFWTAASAAAANNTTKENQR